LAADSSPACWPWLAIRWDSSLFSFARIRMLVRHHWASICVLASMMKPHWKCLIGKVDRVTYEFESVPAETVEFING
jgi:hypothetical protein